MTGGKPAPSRASNALDTSVSFSLIWRDFFRDTGVNPKLRRRIALAVPLTINSSDGNSSDTEDPRITIQGLPAAGGSNYYFVMRTELTERAWRYISKMPPSIDSHNGSAAFFNVALVLIRKFDLPRDIAHSLLREWNTLYAKPPWSEREILHKLNDAFSNSRTTQPHRQHGLSTFTPQPALSTIPPIGHSKGSAESTEVAGDTLLERARLSLRPAMAKFGSRPTSIEEVKARQRSEWPALRPITLSEMGQLAALRQLPIETVYQAHSLGLIRAAAIDGFPCFVFREGKEFAQARRLDGGPFSIQGKHVKAKTLLGSTCALYGCKLLGEATRPVLLVEGCVGLLEALEAIRLQGKDEGPGGWSPLASVSASSRLDEDLLEKMRGRRVRIVPDEGQAGMDFCAVTAASLKSVGCTVDAFRLPPGSNDLGPIVAHPHEHTTLLQQLFTL